VAHYILLSFLLMDTLNSAPALFMAKHMELWPVICSIIPIYYNSPNNRRYLIGSHEPSLRPQPKHSILLSLLLMEPLIPSPALLGAKLMDLWTVTCSTIVHYYNSPNYHRYLTVSHEPRLRPEAAGGTLYPVVSDSNVTCSIIPVYSNSSNNSIYFTVSRPPRPKPQPADSKLLSLLLMEPLNPALALFWAELVELRPVICSSIASYYNLPNNRRYLTVSHDTILKPQVAHYILLSLLLMETLNPAPGFFMAKIMELRPVICSIISIYYNLPNNR
jgi:hypothetical protein